jgi:hypothetical protein
VNTGFSLTSPFPANKISLVNVCRVIVGQTTLCCLARL